MSVNRSILKRSRHIGIDLLQFNPSTVQVVNALKALQRSLVYGEEVSRLLQASPVWAQYEQQRHDLFIQVSPMICT
jgi:DnaJ family protein C protein 13